MSAFILTLHAVLAGVWLGGVVFTTAVVSPALNTVKWGEAERVGCGPGSVAGTCAWRASTLTPGSAPWT